MMDRLKSLNMNVQVLPLNDSERQKLSRALHILQWFLVSAIAIATVSL
ncbi:MAG: hypothetical protein HEP71_30070 [Roseivirga sp.]|nr:hypothetical protein [Roseivirga sp.]